jgi:hypothetical protein
MTDSPALVSELEGVFGASSTAAFGSAVFFENNRLPAISFLWLMRRSKSTDIFAARRGQDLVKRNG